MELPHPYGMNNIGPTLWSTATHQYAVVIRPDAEVSVHKRARPDGAWSSYVISGAARTKLGLPIAPDDHNYMAIAVDSLGYIHLMGNMHAYFNETRYIRSTNPGDITSWSIGSLPGLTTPYRLTYPQFVRRSNGGLMMFMRAYGGSGGGDYHYWHLANNTQPNTWSVNTKIWQGLGVDDPGTPGADDWSAYQSWAEADPITGRLGVSWVWRKDALDADGCRWPSFAYMTGIGMWFDVTGAPLTLPITPYNNPGAHLTHSLYAQDSATPTPIVNVSGFAWDTSSRPHFTLATASTSVNATLSPLDHVYWDGSQWLREPMLSAPENRLSCYAPSAHLFSHEENIHLMGVHGNGSGFISKSLTQAVSRSFWGHTKRHSSLNTPPFNNAIHTDPEARRLHGLAEFLIPDGPNPVVHRYGLRHRITL